MFYRTCDKQVTVRLTSIHNFIHNRQLAAGARLCRRPAAAVGRTNRPANGVILSYIGHSCGLAITSALTLWT